MARTPVLPEATPIGPLSARNGQDRRDRGVRTSGRMVRVMTLSSRETNNSMDDEFVSEDDLLTFEGFLKYQAVPTTSTPEELELWRGLFDEAMRRRESSPKVGLMKLQAVPGEQSTRWHCGTGLSFG